MHQGREKTMQGLENYPQKLKKAKKMTKEQALTDEMINYFQDDSINFHAIYFGVIKHGIGYQGAYEAFRECRTRAGANAQYFWGIIRSMKKEVIWQTKQ